MTPLKTPPPTVTLYGIVNCDTVKKARSWLAGHGIDYTFHDFKKQGVPADLLPAWMAQLGWETLLNCKGTTWRKLDAPTRAAVSNKAAATALMLAQPSVIKRPVMVWADGQISIGFTAEVFAARAIGTERGKR